MGKKKPAGGKGVKEVSGMINDLESRFDAFKSMTEAQDERISELSERLGELREMILETEKTLDEIKDEMGSAKGMKKLSSEVMEKAESAEKEVSRISERISGIEGIRAKLESLDEMKDMIKEIGEEQKRLKGGVREAENMKDSLESIGKRVSELEKSEGPSADESAGLNASLEDMKQRITAMEAGKLSLGTGSGTGEGALEGKLDQLEKRMNEMENAIPSSGTGNAEGPDSDLMEEVKYLKGRMKALENLHLEDLFDQFEHLVVRMKKRQDELEAKIRRMESPGEGIGEPDQKTEAGGGAPEKKETGSEEEDILPRSGGENARTAVREIKDLMKETVENIGKNDMEMARSLYDHVLSMYKSVSDEIPGEEAERLYSDINRISDELRKRTLEGDSGE